MKIFGLIGFPLSHSFSANYFAEKFKRENITGCEYRNFPIDTIKKLPALIQRYPDLKGVNVTIPYKEQVLPFLHRQDPIVRETGACNCIKIHEKKLYGFNTDVTGFEISLQKQLKSEDKKALILGTGGASKAVAFVLKKIGIEYLFVSREKKQNAVSYDDLKYEIISTHTLIINTTPAGMHPKISEAPPINYEAITNNHFLYDLIYNPSRTRFLEHAISKNARISNGLLMLEIQAEESWKIWQKTITSL